MPIDPYAVLRALLRAEAVRNAPKPEARRPEPQRPRRNGRAEPSYGPAGASASAGPCRTGSG